MELIDREVFARGPPRERALFHGVVVDGTPAAAAGRGLAGTTKDRQVAARTAIASIADRINLALARRNAA